MPCKLLPGEVRGGCQSGARVRRALAALEEARQLASSGRAKFEEYLALVGAGTAPSPPSVPLKPEKTRTGHGSSKASHPAGRIKGLGSWSSARAYAARPNEGHSYRPELKPEFNDPEKTTTWHAEGQVAKREGIT